MADKYRNTFVYDKITIPMDIYLERRNGVRVSLGKKSIILRVPKYLSANEVTKFIDWGEKWFSKQVKKNPNFISRFIEKSYISGDSISTTRKSYVLSLVYESRKTLSGRLLNDLKTIELRIPHIVKSNSISTLLSRIIAKDQHALISQRLDDLNDAHYHQNIGQLKLKYNTSNWGSCSSKGNINISTRLLFAPLDVQDYVIIHELAHLIESNHSANFWNIVARIMPSYKNKERWLSENSHLCYF